MNFAVLTRLNNPLRTQRNVRFSLRNLLIHVYGMSDEHKLLHTLTVHMDIFFDVIKLREKCTELC